MESIDKGLQHRVWQRVQGGALPETVSPEGLLLDERTDEAQLRLLGHRELAAQAAERIAILQGLCRLTDIPDAELLPKANRNTGGLAATRMLLGRLLRRHREYTSLANHPEYGIIYDALAHKTRSSCILLVKHTGTSPLRNGRK